MSARWSRWTRSSVLLLSLAVAVPACKSSSSEGAEPASSEPKSNQLPAIELRDGTPNLLLTWVDDKGDFHVVQKTADVPANGRSRVRVVLTDREDGTGKLVYV